MTNYLDLKNKLNDFFKKVRDYIRQATWLEILSAFFVIAYITVVAIIAIIHKQGLALLIGGLVGCAVLIPLWYGYKKENENN